MKNSLKNDVKVKIPITELIWGNVIINDEP